MSDFRKAYRSVYNSYLISFCRAWNFLIVFFGYAILVFLRLNDGGENAILDVFVLTALLFTGLREYASRLPIDDFDYTFYNIAVLCIDCIGLIASLVMLFSRGDFFGTDRLLRMICASVLLLVFIPSIPMTIALLREKYE